MPEEKDPWASLADSLGAASTPEPTSPPPSAPQRQPAKPRPEAKRPTAPPAGWGDIEDALGLPPAREQAAPPRAASRPPERSPEPRQEQRVEPRLEPREPRSFDDRPVESRERRPADFRRDEEPRRAEQSRDRGDEESAFGATPRGESGERRGESDAGGEERPRGRRRRGRRGGRGRGGRDRGPEGREDDRLGGRAPSEARSNAPRDAFDDRADAFDGPEDVSDASIVGPADGADRPPAADRDDEDRPRRRRRRGRRGGRRRGGREREPGETVDASGEPRGDRDEARRAPATQDDLGDDEPLPAGYGVRPAVSKPAEPRSGGESRGRRRRGRRGGSEGARPAGESGGDSSRRRGRRGRRRSGDERSSSSLSRGRRDDFAPVSRGYDEDDEGLEFLGVEEASRDAAPRREPRRTDEDDVLAESGLSSVLDVPSWVEAIGIVIASNLDARSRPKADRSDDDRGRRR